MIAGTNERSLGSSISRTIAGSGSERHRSLERVRRRVSTNDTGASPAAAMASTASAGGRTTSTVGSRPVPISAKPTAASAGPSVRSGTTTDSIVIVTVLGPLVGSMSTRCPPGSNDEASSSTEIGGRSSTATETVPTWRTAADPAGCCSVR